MSKLTGFSNIQTLDPTLLVDLRYATPNNFTGQVIYDFTTAIARTGTAQKLVAANAALRQQGYRLKVWDAYRPVTAQRRLFDVYPDPNFVAQPDSNFSHQKGVTFDLTLCDAAGHELEMQSAFDDFSERAHREYPRTAEQEHNYQLLNQAMLAAGFVGYINEWWDYRDADQDTYAPLAANPNDF
ncbi:D-alanyl-D-alanine dipeptidase [Levilactobacillus zymae]|uniref:D-alanyl-D-alanine dipeptidase n=1 Tax=Levilactobacillus zymae TaxID=267363 RepID=A0ABQ0WYZ3_9LACO|nr:M15 family metallopeptidase [Levilactobacillus zymae]KRL06939.1 d-alanyl-d-alanine dipeptidase [Levilactobacillus zymae DSM 19395]QFR62224.1 D-alanyl-D-alanine dipeptidase [Levilactobacillus zymae]GEO73110.1 D-alanyl-D-alanine dipeptidase [Levilactobacillus zymae]